jgi:hypothetical protein
MYSSFLLESILYETDGKGGGQGGGPTSGSGDGKFEKKVGEINKAVGEFQQILAPFQEGSLTDSHEILEKVLKSVYVKANEILKFRISKLGKNSNERIALEDLKKNLATVFDIEALRAVAVKAYEENGKDIKKFNKVMEAALQNNRVYGPATSALVGKINKLAHALVEVVSKLEVKETSLKKSELLNVDQAKKIIYNGFVKPYLNSLEDAKEKVSAKSGINWKKIGLIIVSFILGAVLIYFSLKMSGVTVTGFASLVNAVEEVLSYSFISALLFLMGVALIGYGLYLTFKPLIVKLVNKIREWWSRRKEEEK